MSPSTLMQRLLLGVAALSLVGCSDGNGPAEPPSTTVPVSTTVSLPPGDDDQPPPAVQLAGTTWRLTALIDEDGQRTDANGRVPAVVSFTDDGVEGYDGVDTATGSYEVDGDAIRIELEEVTELGPPPNPSHEQLFFGLLGQVDRAEIDDGDLVLHHTRGAMRLEPAGGGTAD